MPHTHSRHGSSGDDLGSTDEVKIFKDEGDHEDEKISSENLLVEEKSSLIDLTESEEKGNKTVARPDQCPVFNKFETHAHTFNMGYLVSPYSYANGAAGGLPVTMANKIGLPPFFCHNGDPLTTPPPAHCGIPPYQLDPKAIGLTRPALYPFAASQYPYPMLSPDMSQVASWHTPSVYAASNFRSPYPSSLPINTTLSSEFPFRFSPSILPAVHASPHHVLNSHPAVMSASTKQECSAHESATNNRYSRNLDSKSSLNSQTNDCKDNSNDKKKPHIKKPLNAFMLYMKEMRAKVVAECTLKESAAINQILGRRWHELSREEQSKYYEKARQERQLHMELYPGWSARDNYGYVSKKKKRKKDRSATDSGGNNMKKCRARFGLDQQNQWCKPCRRKKKCIRYMEALNGNGSVHETDDMDDTGNLSQLSEDDDEDEDDLGTGTGTGGSCGSGDELDANQITKLAEHEEDAESMNHSLSSPGCHSGLSSLQSPSTTASLASPHNINMLTSPASTPVVPISNTLVLASAALASGSSSGSSSTCSINNTHNTSSETSPATTSTSTTGTFAPLSANTLGTRFSHLGMGLVTDQIFQVGTLTTSTSSCLATTTTTSTTTAALSSTVPAPATPRNPIGANPRDINNPLSINQLTKRREQHNTVIFDSYSHPLQHPHLYAHPQTHSNSHAHHTLFSSTSFSQHFHQHLSQHLAASTGRNTTGSVSSAVPPIMTTPTLASIKRSSSAETSNGATSNVATPSASSETGAISVS
ncbi:hypothetical protein KR222_009344 [Zaprionus bogoriensis]|nr:hypothetical protein KR222_009344 [Zaprionus bogoriensis]